MRKLISASLALVWAMSGAASAATPPAPARPGADPTVVVQGQRQELTRKRRNAAWFRAESQHFVVYSDVKREDVAALLTKLERFRYVLRSYWLHDAEPETPEAKPELYYLSHEQDLEIANPVGPNYSIGLYQSCEDGTQAYAAHMYYNALGATPLEKQPENEGLSYVFEAYARHYVYQNAYDKQPTWFIDGFAHYFATTRFEGNQAILGLAPEAMTWYLNLIGNQLTYTLDYKDVLRQKDGDERDTLKGDKVKVEYQVRSWILVHYILSSPENLKKFRAYVQLVDAGEDPLKAFEKAFGMNVSQIRKALWDYRRLHLEATRATFNALPEAEVSFFTLPESADKLLLWQSALKACPSQVYGQQLLGKIRDEAPKFPDSELAQRTLSRAEAIWGDPNVAIASLTRDKMPEDFEGLYLLGRAQLSLAAKSGGAARTAALQAARAAFAKASTIDPNSATTAWYYYRAVVLETGKPDEDAQSAALIAWQQAPEIDSFALHAGLVYAYLGRKDDALQALRTVADNPRGRSLAPVAKAWMAKIQAGTDPAALLAAMQADYPAPEGGLTEWTVASAEVIKQVKDAADREYALTINVSTPEGKDLQPASDYHRQP